MSLHVVLLGPPACGKGTQGRLLAEASGAEYFSTGKQLRRELDAGSEMGRRARPFLDAGRYVPDEMALELAFQWLRGVEDGWILDGFPRTGPQARALDEFLGADGESLRAVWLDVATDELERRVGLRLECVECPWVGTQDEAGNGSCPSCGGGLRRREDDGTESFRKRLGAYEELTKPALVHYEDSGRVVHIDGSGSPEEVFDRVRAALKVS